MTTIGHCKDAVDLGATGRGPRPRPGTQRASRNELADNGKEGNNSCDSYVNEPAGRCNPSGTCVAMLPMV